MNSYIFPHSNASESEQHKARLEKLHQKLKSQSIEDQMYACYFLQRDYFYPWHDPKTKGFRVIADELGIPERIAELLRSPTIRVVEHALYCVWLYAETAAEREHMMQLGVADIVLDLAKDPSHVQVIALGTAWSFLEYEEVQVRAINEEVIKANLANTYNHSELVGCIFCCAANPYCCEKIIEQGIAEYLLKVAENHERVMDRYFCCLSLATLCMHDKSGSLDVSAITKMVSDFLAETKPENIYDVEQKNLYSWRTLLPFYKLSESKNEEFRHLSLFSLNNLARRDVNHHMFCDENILSRILVFCWDPPSPIQILANEIISYFATKPKQPPSLLSITLYKIRTHYAAHTDEIPPVLEDISLQFL